MSLGSRLVGRFLRLGPRRSRHIAAEHDIPVPMPDGAVLLADRWYPVGIDRPPIVLLRSPYGRVGYLSMVGRLFAERGYQAVLQSCRGTAGSGGDFTPFRNEAADGRATFEWLERQPWFTGTVGTWGGSYLGLTQWACAADSPDYVKAMATGITATRAGDAVVYPGGTLALESMLRWACENSLVPVKGLRALRRQRKKLEHKLAPAYGVVPLAGADSAVIGKPVDFFQDWLRHDDPADHWWDASDFSADLPRVTVPVSMVAGWYDMFLPYQLEDFAALQDAGRGPRITIGPWAHGDVGMFQPLFQDGFEWLDDHLLGHPAPARKAVRLRLVGTGRWLEFDQWPPPATASTWYLDGGGRLSQAVPPDAAPDSYRYDPSHPTPGIGGASLVPGNKGAKDNRRREARDDVVVYTSEPLARDVTFIGPATAHIHFGSSLRHTDLHVTVCDVEPKGKSTNVSSGIVRLRDVKMDPADPVTLQMWPVGWTVRAGHRIRVQVSSGAHPTYARNLGSGEPLALAREPVVAEQQVFHGGARPSRLELREVSI